MFRKAPAPALALVLVFVGGHHGRLLSRGSGYLADFAPDWLAPMLAHEDAPSEALSDDADPALLVMQTHCFACHGPERQKGGLRLDSPEGLETVLVRVPEEAHGIVARPSHAMSKMTTLLGWFGKHAPEAGE